MQLVGSDTETMSHESNSSGIYGLAGKPAIGLVQVICYVEAAAHLGTCMHILGHACTCTAVVVMVLALWLSPWCLL